MGPPMTHTCPFEAIYLSCISNRRMKGFFLIKNVCLSKFGEEKEDRRGQVWAEGPLTEAIQ